MATTSSVKPKPPAPKPPAPKPPAPKPPTAPPPPPPAPPASMTPTGSKKDTTTPTPTTPDPKLTTVSKLSTTPPTTTTTTTSDVKVVSLASTSSPPPAPQAPATTTKTIDFSTLKTGTPTAPAPGTTNTPTRPDPRDPNNPTPLGQTAPFNEADKPAINKLYGELIGDMNNLSSVNRSQAAAITGKDFSNIKPEPTEAAFVPQVQNFLTNIVDDGKRVEALGKDGKTYLDNINGLNTKLEDFRTAHNYTNDQMKAAMDPTTQGLMKASTEELANSTATLADTGKTYGDRLDSKASELLGAWDTSKHTEQKQAIVDAITTAFSLFANVGIGGNAIVQLAVKDAAKVTEGVGEAWNAVGLRSGQVANLFGAITAADLKGYAGSNPGATAAELDSKAGAGHQHLQDLADRFHKYVDDFNNQTPPDPNPFVIV